MGEEILSPTSDPSHTPPQTQKEALQPSRLRNLDKPIDLAGKSNHAQRRFSQPKKRNNEGKVIGNDVSSKAKRTGLNVITDFSKGVEAVTNLSKPQTHTQKSANRPRAEMGKSQGELNSSPRHQRSGKNLKGSVSKSRLDDLKRSSTKSSNLSPSDRAVVIGLSISPKESPEKENNLGSDLHAQEKRQSHTPSIIVTPAKDVPPWSPPDRTQASPPSRTAASSVYSQMPAPGSKRFAGSKVPPVPPLSLRAGSKGENKHEQKVDREKITSNCTIFDEESSPDATAGFRPGSRDSQQHMLAKTDSADTLANKRQSQGWWNIIKSPFFPKSPMSLKFRSSPQVEDAPPIPTPTRKSPPRHSQKAEIVDDSPGRNRKSQVAVSAHTSWTDSSVDMEAERGRMSFGAPINSGVEDLKTTSKQNKPESYVAQSPFQGLGASSEYFEACLYDMHSTTPYFECQNHRCWPSTLGIGGYVPRGVDGPQAPPIARGMAIDPAASQGPGEAKHELTKGDKSKEESPIPSALPVPTNRFSASFREATDPKAKAKARPESETTMIEDLDATPDVQEARAAPVVKAPEPVRAVNPPPRKESLSQEPSSIHESPYFNKPAPTPKALPTPPPRLPAKDTTPENKRDFEHETPSRKFISGLPPNPRHKTYEEPFSPTPPTPTPQGHDETPHRGIAMTEVSKLHSSRETSPSGAPQSFHVTNHYYPGYSKRGSRLTTTADLWPPPRPARPLREDEPADYLWQTKEKRDQPPKEPMKTKIVTRLKRLLQGKQTPARRRSQMKHEKKRKRLLIIVTLALILLIILILVLAMTLTHRGDRTPIESQWLNITGYPPVPTGFSTVAQPDPAHEESGCVQPTTMWSCALPKEDQQAIQPNAPNQPNFRIEIRFQNGTNATTGNASRLSTRAHTATNAVSASNMIRTKLLSIRDTLNSGLSSPSPSPPNQEDESFLGDTTDKVEAPFDGEFTPFYMTFHPATTLPSRLVRRDDSSDQSSSNSSNQFPDLSTSIPDAYTNPDGTASPASMYPYPSSQPLRLFDRGRPSEHYGFYTYFDRSIFLKSTAPLNASTITGNTEPTDPDDGDGGSEERSASVRCTWAQTRFLVQIWTNKGSPAPLLQGNSTSPSHPDNHSGNNVTHLRNGTDVSSANDFARPGSFPYPISITLDRHGGDIGKKMIYCYGLDNDAKPIPDSKRIQLEDRAFGGKLENPALGPFGDVKVSTKDGGPGGIDGGSGGCGCTWQNWK
ncbi:uncharacterized protein KY384_004100 [Bacidia gigantensis]|uniref:uncharacterized protein n=1 Tax=Bacidia gigantensis TaxID=2732470 RepID=UPI001D03E61D|nr:uncharacterized protein KY384_004100 [Bacidia gigantensis]KAG8530743.1 hypothetical protein KY384_004100 [Bacidia gigantensis]